MRKVSVKKESARKISVKKESARKISAKKESARKISAKKKSATKMSVKKESVRKVSVKKESARKISVKKESARKISVKKESARKISVRKLSTIDEDKMYELLIDESNDTIWDIMTAIHVPIPKEGTGLSKQISVEKIIYRIMNGYVDDLSWDVGKCAQFFRSDYYYTPGPPDPYVTYDSDESYLATGSWEERVLCTLLMTVTKQRELYNSRYDKLECRGKYVKPRWNAYRGSNCKAGYTQKEEGLCCEPIGWDYRIIEALEKKNPSEARKAKRKLIDISIGIRDGGEFVQNLASRITSNLAKELGDDLDSKYGLNDDDGFDSHTRHASARNDTSDMYGYLNSIKEFLMSTGAYLATGAYAFGKYLKGVATSWGRKVALFILQTPEVATEIFKVASVFKSFMCAQLGEYLVQQETILTYLDAASSYFVGKYNLTPEEIEQLKNEELEKLRKQSWSEYLWKSYEQRTPETVKATLYAIKVKVKFWIRDNVSGFFTNKYGYLDKAKGYVSKFMTVGAHAVGKYFNISPKVVETVRSIGATILNTYVGWFTEAVMNELYVSEVFESWTHLIDALSFDKCLNAHPGIKKKYPYISQAIELFRRFFQALKLRQLLIPSKERLKQLRDGITEARVHISKLSPEKQKKIYQNLVQTLKDKG